MIAYVVREKFSGVVLRLLNEATWLVDRASDERAAHVGLGQYRCHELARAVCARLCGMDTYNELSLAVVDGQLGPIEHTWINVGYPQSWPRPAHQAILDVYTPGRIPQVQLIDDHHFLTHEYQAGADRADINHAMIADIRGWWV